MEREQRMRVIRVPTEDECWWIREGQLKVGDTVYLFEQTTYGVIGNGTAVSFVKGEYPFFEIPWDAIEPDDDAEVN